MERTRKCGRFGIGAIVFIFVMYFSSVSGQNSNTTGSGSTTTSGDTTNARPIDQGMSVFYTMTNGFLDILQQDDIFVLLKELGIDVDNTSLDALETITDDIHIDQDWQTIAEHYIGYVICLVIGLLFVIIMPIVGCCFCCCRCCGRCGGQRRPYEKKNDGMCRICCGGVLGILLVVLLAGVVCVFVTNTLLKEQTTDGGEHSALISITQGINRLDLYVDTTMKDLERAVVGGLQTEITQQVNRLKAAPDKALDYIDSLTNSEAILAAVQAVTEDIQRINATLVSIKDSTDKLKADGNKLSQELDSIKLSLKNNLQNCAIQVCTDLVAEVDKMQTEADFSNVDSVQESLDNIQNVLNQNFVQMVQDSIDSYNHIVDDVRNDTSEQIHAIERQANEIVNQTKSAIYDITKAAKNLNFSSYNEAILGVSKDVDKYGEYRYYAGIGIGALFALILVLYCLGLCVGACGGSPDREGCSRAGGSPLLMAGVGFTFLCTWLMMLLLIILFLVGGFLYTEVCRNILPLDDSLFINKADKLLVNFVDSGDLPGNISLADFSLSSTLARCKQDQAFMQAVDIDKLINISKFLNIDNYGIRDVIDELTKVDYNLSSVEILTDETKAELDNLKNAKLDNINLTSFRDELNKSIVSIDLTSLAAQVRQAADAIANTDPAKANALRADADEIDRIQSTTVRDMNTEMGTLSNSVDELERLLKHGSNGQTFEQKIDRLTRELQAVDTAIQVNGSKYIGEFIKKLGDDMYNDIKTFLDSLLTEVKTQVGKCGSLYSALEQPVVTVCEDVLNPFNGFWFGIGWCIFFCVICIFLAVKLSSLYRPADQYEDAKSFDEPNYDAYSGGYHADTIPLQESTLRPDYQTRDPIYVNQYEGSSYREERYNQQTPKSGGGYSGRHNTGFESDGYTASRSGHYTRDNIPYHENGGDYRNGGTGYNQGGYYGGGGDGYHGGQSYGGPSQGNPPHYFNNAGGRMY